MSKLQLLSRGMAVCLICLYCTGFEAFAADGPAKPQAQRQSNADLAKHRPVYSPPRLTRPGRPVRHLPDGYTSFRVRRDPYYYHHGVFYRPHPSYGFIVVNAPVGAHVGYLPPGYVSFWHRDRRYFYVNLTYYLWDDHDREYLVVRAPKGATEAMVAASDAGSSELFVYPTRGQSEQQRDQDRYECYLWAVEQVGYDPAGTVQDFSRAGDYRRALTACLEGRGYAVK